MVWPQGTLQSLPHWKPIEYYWPQKRLINWVPTKSCQQTISFFLFNNLIILKVKVSDPLERF